MPVSGAGGQTQQAQSRGTGQTDLPYILLIGDRLKGCLVASALGDELGLPAEKLSAGQIFKMFGRIADFKFSGEGIPSDDTHQHVKACEALIREPKDSREFQRNFQRRLALQKTEFSYGAGWTPTLLSLKILGFGQLFGDITGRASAGNGVLMRTAAVGVYFAEDPVKRSAFARALALATHNDPMAADSAEFFTHLVALAATSSFQQESPSELLTRAERYLTNPKLKEAVGIARTLAADSGMNPLQAAEKIGTGMYCPVTLSLSLYSFLRHGRNLMKALVETIALGGDTDTRAAILGGLIGAWGGTAQLPESLLGRMQTGRYGIENLNAIAEALVQTKLGDQVDLPRLSQRFRGESFKIRFRNISSIAKIVFHSFLRMPLRASALMGRGKDFSLDFEPASENLSELK